MNKLIRAFKGFLTSIKKTVKTCVTLKQQKSALLTDTPKINKKTVRIESNKPKICWSVKVHSTLIEIEEPTLLIHLQNIFNLNIEKITH